MSPKSETVTEEIAVSKAPVSKTSSNLVWKNIYFVCLLHLLASYATFLILTGRVSVKPFLIGYAIGIVGSLGVTAGAHRLWSHRTYKAKTPLRIFLMLMNCVAYQGDIHEWSRDHRVHHKYSDTDADPYNASRGFFFSHIGWVMLRKHPDVKSKGKAIDCSDILADPVVRFQIKYYQPLSFLMCFVLPTWIQMSLVDITWWNSFLVSSLRYCISLHFTWLVNSAAHMWGYRPYDENISPRENAFVSMLASGEGFHNYHHTFPWDYSTSEYGIKLNLTTAFINLMAKIGQAYDLKSVTPEIIKNRKLRTGEENKGY